MSFAAYVTDLAAHLRHSYRGNSCHRREDRGGGVVLDMDPPCRCGLLITSFSPSAEIRLPEGTGAMWWRLQKSGTDARATVSDDGVGFPADFDFKAPATLGLRIVNTLTAQLSGTLTLRRERGTTIEITFPAP